MYNTLGHVFNGLYDTWPNEPKYGYAVPGQNLDLVLFHNSYDSEGVRSETSWVGKLISLAFHPYKEIENRVCMRHGYQF